MFLGKRQPCYGYAPALPTDQVMPSANMPEVSGYAAPGHVLMPGYEFGGVAAPGTVESMHASRTEFDMPSMYCPGHFEHAEFDLDIEPSPKHQVYVVKKGDTVYKIAKRYGLDWRELAGYNHLGNPDLIYPGQRLMIPSR